MMKELERLFDRIILRVNVNLREHDYDVNPLVQDLISADKMTKFYAFYGITPHHPLNFQFRNSNLAGSHFMGKCQVRDELAELLHDFSLDSQTEMISAKFAFSPEFNGFTGHFPGNPILPGICQIQCILVLISKHLGEKVSLSSVKRARFLNTVIPEDEILVKGKIACSKNTVLGDFVISKNSQQEKVIVSRMKIQGIISNSHTS